MEPISQILRFGTDAPRLSTAVLLAIAVGSALGVAFLAWLVRSDGESAGMEVLAPPVAALLAASGIWVGGSWNDVVVDATSRRVTERHGFLGYPIGFLGKQLPFEQISGVMVERKISKDTEAKGTSMSPGTRTVYRTTYAVSLLTGETRLQ